MVNPGLTTSRTESLQEGGAGPRPAAIEIKHLSKAFDSPLPRLRRLLGRPPGERVQALLNINLRIAEGELFGLVGRNGQGKTTLIKCIAALIEPNEGSIRVFGYNARRQDQEVKRRLGLVTSEERSFYGRLTGRQNLMFYAQLYGLSSRQARDRIAELVETFDYAAMIDRQFQTLSSGNKQKLAILRALLTDPPLILLDEPTRSLDPIAADELRRQIHQRLNIEQKKTIFITTHNLAEIESLCSRVGFLYQGGLKLCAGMNELMAEYCNREWITLRLQGLAELNGLGDDLRRQVSALAWRPLGEDRLELSFEREADDETLDLVLGRLRAHGVRVLACQAQRDGLRQIMEQVER